MVTIRLPLYLPGGCVVCFESAWLILASSGAILTVLSRAAESHRSAFLLAVMMFLGCFTTDEHRGTRKAGIPADELTFASADTSTKPVLSTSSDVVPVITTRGAPWMRTVDVGGCQRASLPCRT